VNPTDLIAGPYTPPSLKKGARTFCLYRDATVVITSWSDAPIPWPRCRALHCRGGSGLLVDAELLRAIRTESAEALKYWFGVSTKAVWNWRRSFGIEQWGTEGSKQLLEQNTAKAHLATRGKSLDLTPVQRREWSKRMRIPKRKWTPEEDTLALTLPADEVAERTGRTVKAVEQRLITMARIERRK
jgi:hypothetical protein